MTSGDGTQAGNVRQTPPLVEALRIPDPRRAEHTVIDSPRYRCNRLSPEEEESELSPVRSYAVRTFGLPPYKPQVKGCGDAVVGRRLPEPPPL